MNFKTVDSGRGVGWIGDGWNLVKRQLGEWIFLVVVYLLIQVVLQLIPILGGIVAALIAPGLMAGVFLATRYVDEDKTINLKVLFQPLMESRTREPLLKLGAVAIVFAILIVVVMVNMFVSFSHGGTAFEESKMMNENIDITLLFSFWGGGVGWALVFLLLGALYSMAMWFALQLVLFAGVAPFDAMKISFKAALANWLPILLFCLLLVVLGFLLEALLEFFVTLPLLLGSWLLLMPVLFAIMYVSYKEVFDMPEEVVVVIE